MGGERKGNVALVLEKAKEKLPHNILSWDLRAVLKKTRRLQMAGDMKVRGRLCAHLPETRESISMLYSHGRSFMKYFFLLKHFKSKILFIRLSNNGERCRSSLLSNSTLWQKDSKL